MSKSPRGYEPADHGPSGPDLRKSPHTRQDNYGMKYSGSRGTAATGGPWKESPGQGGGGERGVYVGGNIKGKNKVAP